MPNELLLIQHVASRFAQKTERFIIMYESVNIFILLLHARGSLYKLGIFKPKLDGHIVVHMWPDIFLKALVK